MQPLLVISDRQKLAALQQRVSDQIVAVGRVEHENVVRRMCIGLALPIIKDSLKHGEYTPWLKNATKGGSYTQITYMVRLAQEWREKARLKQPEVSALPNGDFSLDVQDAALRKLVASAEKFVGNLSWTELLQKHGIKDTPRLGGARDKRGADVPADSDPEQLYLFSRDEIGGVIHRAEELLVKENRLQHLIGHPEEVRGVVESLRSLADKVEAAAKPLLKKS